MRLPSFVRTHQRQSIASDLVPQYCRRHGTSMSSGHSPSVRQKLQQELTLLIFPLPLLQALQRKTRLMWPRRNCSSTWRVSQTCPPSHGLLQVLLPLLPMPQCCQAWQSAPFVMARAPCGCSAHPRSTSSAMSASMAGPGLRASKQTTIWQRT